MNQQKIGSFLKNLRKEKNMTQEQLAEILNVSSRTVSRWETGNNMPDLSILVELADYYDVDIREIINRERKSENMNDEMKDTLEQVAQYSKEEKEKLKKGMMGVTFGAAILSFFAHLLDVTNGFNVIPESSCKNMIDFASGFSLAILVMIILYLSGILEKISKCKK